MPFAAIFTLCAVLAQSPTQALELDATRRLGAAWNRAAIGMISDPSRPAAESFRGAVELAVAAAELAPDDAQAWRSVVDLAELADPGQPEAMAAYRRALKELSRIDPADQSVALARVSEAVERAPTADDRVKIYDRLLDASSRRTLGAAVSARLALDRALLEKRRGSTVGWQKWLREAVAIDPAFPLAAETLAGVESGSDASLKQVGIALARAITANPSSVVSISALSRLCLHEGLYEEADRLLTLAVRVSELNVDLLLIDELLADRMIALWGLGRHEDALKIYSERRRKVNAALRRRLGDSGANASESEQSVGPQVNLPTVVNSVAVAIMASQFTSPSGVFQPPDEARRKRFEEALAYTLDGITQERDEAKGDAAKAVLGLRKAWIEATIGDPASVDGLLESAQGVSPMSDEAVARFQGWVRLRRNDFQGALDRLQPIAATDEGARAGLAMAMAGLGRQRDAAREFHEAIKSDRDNAVGLWAADRLVSMVGKRPGPSSEAAGLREAVTTIPAAVFDLANNQALALSVSVTFGPPALTLDPMPLRISIQNRSALPLEIGPGGPIDGKAALNLEYTRIGDAKSRPMPPAIIAIDRKLRLEPRETMNLEIDMSRTSLGSELLEKPLSSVFVKARMVTNFRLTSDALQAGFLGNLSEEATLRLPAVQITPGWREDAIGEIRNPDKPEDLVKLVLMAYDLVRRKDSGDADLESGWTAVCEAWTKLPPAGQAWALMTLPSPKEPPIGLRPVIEAAKVSTDALVRVSYLLRWVQSPDDVQFAAAERQGGRLATVAMGMRAMRRSQVEDQADASQGDEVGVLGGGGSSDGR